MISLAVFCFLGVRNALHADPLLQIQKVVIEPPGALTLETRVALESRLLGRHILEVDLASVADGLAGSADIRSIRVMRKLPDALVVKVATRSPVAFIRFSASSSYGLVSEDGVILDLAQKSNTSLVTIDAFDLGVSMPRVGDQIRVRGFAEMMQFLKAFSEHDLASKIAIAKLGLDRLGNVTLEPAGAPPIRLGRSPAEKLGALEKAWRLLEEEKPEDVEYVDLQFDDILVKRKKGWKS